MIVRVIVLSMMLLGVYGCATKPATPPPAEAKPEEVMADILVRASGDTPLIEITFYTPISEILNGKENKGFGKNVIAVQDPQFNGSPLTAATNLSGQPVYRIGIDKAAARNTVTATVNGKQFEGSTIIETKMVNKMTTVALEMK